MGFVFGLYFGFFSFAYSLLPSRWFRPWIGALVWVGLDQLHCVLLTGFPWAFLAHTQSGNLPLLQLASLAGAGGITFLLVLFNSSVAQIKNSPRNFAAVCFIVACTWGWGKHRLNMAGRMGESTRSFKVAILQGNIDQYAKWDTRYEASVRQKYEGLVLQASAFKPDLIVWPESAIPGWYPNQKKYVEWVRRLATQSKTHHLIGAVTSRDGKDYNAAFLITPDGTAAAEYDKQHLVPFGEYIPFGGILKKWIPYLGQLGTFAAGERPVLFEVAGARLAPNICYEAIFPNLVRKSVLQGADIIVNITNDGWFLNTGAPEQHYVANIFRAVETGRPVIRAANTGISAVIDPHGREIVRSRLLTTGVFTATISLISLK